LYQAEGMMLTFTDAARAKVREILAAKGQQGFAVRLRITGRDTENFLYEFRSVEEATRRADDHVVDAGDFAVFVDPSSAGHLDGAVIDFGGLGGGGFKIDNPNPVWEDDTSRRVAEVIETQINPAVAAHSGRITLVDVKDNVAYVRMQGGCQGCGMAGVTLRQGIERQLRGQVPEIEGVVDVTSHEQGTNPYYAPGQSGRSPVEG
jgi:Fe/S biogenesis protein NfuA